VIVVRCAAAGLVFDDDLALAVAMVAWWAWRAPGGLVGAPASDARRMRDGDGFRGFHAGRNRA